MNKNNKEQNVEKVMLLLWRTDFKRYYYCLLAFFLEASGHAKSSFKQH
jgi:hypothetical protein